MRPGERQRVLRVVTLTAVQCLRGRVGEGLVRWSPASPVGSETQVARPAESSRCQTTEGSYGQGFPDAEVAIAGIGLISGAACLAATTICFSEQCLSFESVVTFWNKTLR